MSNDKVYEALKMESDKIGPFGHGFTYSGHPVAAAVALEVVKDKKTKEAFDLATVGAGLKVYNQAVERGLFIRNMGDRIAICPPLIINETELDDLFGRLRQALDAAMTELKADGHFTG